MKKGHFHFAKEEYELALKHYLASALANHTEALYNVAYCFEKGIGVARNITRAVSLYQKMLFVDNWMVDLIAILSILRANYFAWITR